MGKCHVARQENVPVPFSPTQTWPRKAAWNRVCALVAVLVNYTSKNKRCLPTFSLPNTFSGPKKYLQMVVAEAMDVDVEEVMVVVDGDVKQTDLQRLTR
jgi:hypothetical protein